ncbi:hypothetical protein ANN_22371 [Periplaneta americana]|uniref:Uncharacterized protein n=1 Tax=Periplaneta americana TaxID=6978 RepID=A0ABQ8S8S1_PERAM|nr:hypothetical protein ANN_22371 [Periplaneta americana]
MNESPSQIVLHAVSQVTKKEVIMMLPDKKYLKTAGRDDPHRILIFATVQNLQYLSHNPTIYEAFRTIVGQEPFTKTVENKG